MLEYSGGADFDFQINVLCVWYNKVTLINKVFDLSEQENVSTTLGKNVKIHLREIDHADRERYERRSISYRKTTGS